MKNLVLYHIGALLIIFTAETALAVKFDIKKGFVYEESEIEAQKQAAIEKKLSQPYVKVLRLFNEDNRISDPVLASNTEPTEEVQFLTLNDKTNLKSIDQAEEVREVASLNGSMDWLVIEKELLELESQFGIRSMPVVQFASPESLDKKSFAHRVAFLEGKLGIQPDNAQISAIPQRLTTIKQKLNVETETMGLEVDLSL